MRLVKDTFFIKADKNANDFISLKGHDGKPLMIDTDIEKFKHAVKVGTVAVTPLEISDEYFDASEIPVGATVLFHHHVVQPERLVIVDGEEFYRADYFHLFAYIQDDVLIPVEQFIFCEPILEPEENLWHGMFHLKAHRENLKGCAKVIFSSRRACEEGIVPGDIVYFTKNADYDINVFGRDYWRMRIRNIIAVDRAGKLVCFKDKLVVKPIDKFLKTDFIHEDKSRDFFGEVIEVGNDVKDIVAGDKVNYCHGVTTKLSRNGEELSILAVSNINYVV